MSVEEGSDAAERHADASKVRVVVMAREDDGTWRKREETLEAINCLSLRPWMKRADMKNRVNEGRRSSESLANRLRFFGRHCHVYRAIRAPDFK